jgi:protein gp37
MVSAPRHTFQILTKRSRRLAEIALLLPWPKNVWIGVSVENSRYIPRILDLATVPAALRFLSLEPLLGPIDNLPLKGISWVIVGGESGHTARPMDPDWVRSLRDQCHHAGVPFFFKQYGGRKGKRGGLTAYLDGRLWHQFPNALDTSA